MVLKEYFEAGWDPDNFGLYKLEEATVTWLKGMDTISLVEKESLPAELKEALLALGNLKKSAAELERVKKAAAEMNNAAAKTAEVKFSGYLNDMLKGGHDQESAQQGLQQRKKVLETWVRQCMEKSQKSIDTRECAHSKVRETFQKMVTVMVRLSHSQYKVNESKPELEHISDDDLVAELEMELEKALPGCHRDAEEETPCQLVPREAPKTPQVVETKEAEETPISTVTSAFTAMSLAIDNVVASQAIPEEIRDRLVGSMQACVKNALEGKDKPIEPKEKPKAASPVHQDIPSFDTERGPIDLEEELFGEMPVPDAPEPSTAPTPATTPSPTPGSTRPAALRTSIPTVNAIQSELQRQDTTNKFTRANTAELEEEALAKCKVEMEDGTFRYMNKRGKLETLEEREKRLSHNSFVAFSRSFEGSLS